MGTRLVPAVISQSRETHKTTFIFLHGLGDTGHGWSSILKTLIPDHCKLVCPNAPSIPVTLNGGMRMPAWFDIYDLGAHARQDESGIVEASKQLEQIIESELSAGIPSNKIVIGGFSQGGSVALYHALTSDRNFGGLTGLSTWLPLHEKFTANPSMIKIPRSTAMFLAHGTMDMVVDHQLGVTTHNILKQFGLSSCEFNSYPLMGHSSNDKEMSDLQQFLTKVLSD